MNTITKKNLNEKRLVLTGVADNDTFVIPAGYRVSFIIAEALTETAGNITIGKSGSLESLVASVALPTTIGELKALTVVTPAYSSTAATTMIVNISSAATANLYVELDKFI